MSTPEEIKTVAEAIHAYGRENSPRTSRHMKTAAQDEWDEAESALTAYEQLLEAQGTVVVDKAELNEILSALNSVKECELGWTFNCGNCTYCLAIRQLEEIAR